MQRLKILARVGADIHFGRGFSGAFFVRDPVTGQRYCVIPGKVNQIGFSVGGDVGHVAKSAFFDEKSVFFAVKTVFFCFFEPKTD